ncbi:hypothetical protein E2C01_024920 [Portunus trituberculatus]|uniref:Uncharacterized protein n=1 Tax=Portunus trituberculatus TaxID=210409 RepID=A0A5B7EE42_PORTR|nr:hypothetical protein [Portunus trituberculatus]
MKGEEEEEEEFLLVVVVLVDREVGKKERRKVESSNRSNLTACFGVRGSPSARVRILSTARV